MSEDLPSTNKAPPPPPPNDSVFFWLARRVPGYQFNLPGAFLNATIAPFWLCLSGPAEKVVSRRRSDNVMDVC